MKTTIQTIKTNYPKISLKKICENLNLCYQYVLKASKKPIPNKPYDPTEFNYEEVDKIIEKKQINLDDYDWLAIENEIKVITPINKIDEFEINTKFKIRNDENEYQTIYITETHIVFMSTTSTQPRVMNWDTFVHQSPRIVK